MSTAIFTFPKPVNEPIYSYAPGTKERELLEKELERQYNQTIEIPVIIGGKEIYTGNTDTAVMPSEHGHVLATYHQAGEKEINMAIEASMQAKKEWAALPMEDRASIALKAAELISKKYRYLMNAATMLNQGKTAYQAEIDSACEIIDFLRFNVKYMEDIYKQQPESSEGVYNRLEYRPLEGFVFAVTPFNFTAIAGNLPSSAALMGNTVVWKPASTSVLSGYYLMKIFKEAGFPDGVINFIPGRGSQVGRIVMAHKDLGGIHFTGSTGVFHQMWKTVGENIAKYKSYPRIVGETGGKDFIFTHKSADPIEVATALVRGAFEYQGQKCSACSRAYIPNSLWPEIKETMGKMLSDVKMGCVRDFKNFVSAVIDKNSYSDLKGYIDNAKNDENAEVIFGGNCDDSVGYFIEPTVILAKDPKYVTMETELFGPVLTIYVYEDEKYEETLELCDTTSIYALTGSIFAKDRYAARFAINKLENAAGNFYINDKPTGAVVGQQPFGGARASGTNDKAGSHLNLMRWVSPRTIKETFVTPTCYKYPFMD
ncbi:MAG: L-glutamate gamma-semialdehyde dehydrogenase [Candidatus Delongbacteria bacterium]|nr:L-glutamate gamma-semialdehyde dehydrogenase [Candidatus Delongbacteria bacterium]MBN2835802.1 L-glutamate gamma-semialdehyde dehydrogenase [Candidatus Delongbacteria bacterium]